MLLVRLSLFSLSLERALTCKWSCFVFRTTCRFHVKAEQTCIRWLKLYLLASTVHCPFPGSSSLPTLFLVNDIEQVWSENVRSTCTASGLLVDSSRVSPLIFHLHVVSGSLLAPRDKSVRLLHCECSSCLVRSHLCRVIHANLVHSVIAFI